MRHGSARKALLFVALVALGAVIGVVLTRPARPHIVNLLFTVEVVALRMSGDGR
jgi:hypothetical protein